MQISADKKIVCESKEKTFLLSFVSFVIFLPFVVRLNFYCRLR